ncbi:MAG: VOC family protein, partial [Bosea sp. (in: a-proteobacteria)]
EALFGRKVALPPDVPSFDFAIPDDGSLPLNGGLPSLIDRRGKPRSMATIADKGARLTSFSLVHPEAGFISDLLSELGVDLPPIIERGAECRFRAQIATANGVRTLF